MAKNPFRAVRLSNKATAKILRTDTKADYKFTQTGLDAITGNLLSSQTGLGRTLSKQSARTLGSMQRVSQRAGRQIRSGNEAARTGVINKYGSVLGSDPNLWTVARATAKGNKAATKGILGGAKTLRRAGNESMDILKQAGASASKSADYELAQAYSARSQADAATIAQAQADLASQRAAARANERIAMIQQGMDPNGTGSSAYQSAAAALNQGLLGGEITESEATTWARRFANQYNLGPKETQDLIKLAQVGAGGNGGPDGNSTPYGEAYREQYDVSPSGYLDDATEQTLNDATVKAYDPKQPVPNKAEAMAIMGVSYNAEGKVLNADGSEVPQERIDAGVAYIQSTWYRLKNHMQQLASPGSTRTADMALRDPANLPNPSGQALSDESLRTGLPVADGRLRADSPNGTVVTIDGYTFQKTQNGWFPSGR